MSWVWPIGCKCCFHPSPMRWPLSFPPGNQALKSIWWLYTSPFSHTHTPTHTHNPTHTHTCRPTCMPTPYNDTEYDRDVCMWPYLPVSETEWLDWKYPSTMTPAITVWKGGYTVGLCVLRRWLGEDMEPTALPVTSLGTSTDTRLHPTPMHCQHIVFCVHT